MIVGLNRHFPTYILFTKYEYGTIKMLNMFSLPAWNWMHWNILSRICVLVIHYDKTRKKKRIFTSICVKYNLTVCRCTILPIVWIWDFTDQTLVFIHHSYSWKYYAHWNKIVYKEECITYIMYYDKTFNKNPQWNRNKEAVVWQE